MKMFQASSPSVEVSGQAVQSFIAGMAANASRAERILATFGINQPKPNEWYPQQAWLNAFKEIAEMLGPNTLCQIGRKIPENAKLPPGINDVHKALDSLNAAYQLNHRGGDIGSYGYEKTGNCSAKMICRNPYPSDFDRGLILAMADRFKPSGATVSVELDSSQPNRNNGGESCTFLVKW